MVNTERNRIEEYYESNRLNASKIKVLSTKSVQELKKPLNSSAPHFIIGSAVDTILTGEIGDFERNYYVMNQSAPTESIANIMSSVLDYFQKDWENSLEYENCSLVEYIGRATELQAFDSILLEYIKQAEYQKNWKDETKINKVKEAGLSYLRELAESQYKTVIDVAQFEQIQRIVKSLRESPSTKRYFDRETLSLNPLVEMWYQVPIYFEYKEVECKALLDMVLIDHKNQRVYPIDLKTMSGNVIDFPENARKYGYGIQAQFYNIAIFYLLEQLNISHYMTANFIFVVESSTNPGTPATFSFKIGSLPFFYQKIDKVIEDYKYYLLNGFEIDRAIAEATQPITMDEYGNIV